MRIFNRDTNETFTHMELFFTKDEAERFIDELQFLLKRPDTHHFHLHCDEKDIVPKGITVTIYNDDNLDTFDPRSRKLILEDK